jgi:hypothetical protein
MAHRKTSKRSKAKTKHTGGVTKRKDRAEWMTEGRSVETSLRQGTRENREL